MDVHHCWGNRSRALLNVYVLDISLIFLGALLYAVNTLLIKPRIASGFFHFQFNDFLAMIVALAVGNIIIGTVAHRYGSFRSLPLTLAFVAIAGSFWEFATPLYKTSVTDVHDFIAYSAGGLIYWMLLVIQTQIMQKTGRTSGCSLRRTTCAVPEP
jgi:hypothetical protein